MKALFSVTSEVAPEETKVVKATSKRKGRKIGINFAAIPRTSPKANVGSEWAEDASPELPPDTSIPNMVQDPNERLKSLKSSDTTGFMIIS